MSLVFLPDTAMPDGCVHGRIFPSSTPCRSSDLHGIFVFHRPAQGASPWGLGGRETTEEGEFVFPFAPWASWTEGASFQGKPGLEVNFDNNSVIFAAQVFKRQAVCYRPHRMIRKTLLKFGKRW